MEPRLTYRMPVALALLAAAQPVFATIRAQTPAAAPGAHAPPEVGQAAPDFSLPGATRYGLLRSPVRLADYRGKTVVLAFFARARTRG